MRTGIMGTGFIGRIPMSMELPQDFVVTEIIREKTEKKLVVPHNHYMMPLSMVSKPKVKPTCKKHHEYVKQSRQPHETHKAEYACRFCGFPMPE